MHFRRLACFLLGGWLAGGFFMAAVATQNFRSVDRLLAKPAPLAREQVDKLGGISARALLRYQVAEQNRVYFETWGVVETALRQRRNEPHLAACPADVADRGTTAIPADAGDRGPGARYRLRSSHPAIARARALLDQARHLFEPRSFEMGTGVGADREAAVPQKAES
jgi:hypothetical protein